MRASIFWRRLLRSGLSAGGLLDLALAGALVAGYGPRAIGLFGQRLSSAFYLRPAESPEAFVVAILLAALGLACLAAANEPRRYSALVWIASAERLALAAVLAAAGFTTPGRDPLELFALVELVLGLSHLVPRWRLGR